MQVDIFAQLQNASEAFRTYIRDGLAQVCLLSACFCLWKKLYSGTISLTKSNLFLLFVLIWKVKVFHKKKKTVSKLKIDFLERKQLFIYIGLGKRLLFIEQKSQVTNELHSVGTITLALLLLPPLIFKWIV